MATNAPLNRKLRMALVGGGQGSFIGRVHATAAVLDNRAALVAGCLSSDPARAKASAPDYDIPADRAYTSINELVEKEKALPADQRVDFVSVATPNHTHFQIAKTAAEAGLNVICDKPMTFDLKQAEQLAEIVNKSGVVFAVTHNYTGYPLVRQAREMILAGELGEINAVRSNYIQGWLRTRLEISCHLKTFEQGRALDDYGTALIKFENGGFGCVTASQISHGRENDLSIEIDGTKGAIQWRQEEPNVLVLRQNGQPHKLYTRNGGPYIGAASGAASRLPSGHPEAFFEAFANVYRSAYDNMILRAGGQKFEKVDTIYPNINDGVEGMYFIQQAVESSQQGGAWLPLKHALARR